MPAAPAQSQHQTAPPPVSGPRSWLAWIYGCTGACAGCLALDPLSAGQWSTAILLHLVGVAGVTAAADHWKPARKRNDRTAGSRRTTDGLGEFSGTSPRASMPDPFVAITAAVVPALGPVLAWIHLVGARTVPRGTLMQDYSEHLDATAHAGQQEHTRSEAIAPVPEQLASLADVISSDASDDYKRSAIENLARMETPQAVDVLRKTLAHPSVEVRFYAAGALDHLERRLATRVEALERQLASAGGTDPVVLFALAQACFDHSYYHVATDRRRTAQLEKALTHARHALDANGDVNAWILSGRTLLELHRYGEAEICFQRYLTIRPDDVKGLLWHAEALFRLGRFKAVRATCAKARRVGTVPARMEAAVWMWA